MANQTISNPIDPGTKLLIERLRAHHERVQNIAWTDLRRDLELAANTIETLIENISERDGDGTT